MVITIKAIVSLNLCLAIIQLYFIRTFSYVLSSVEYIIDLKSKNKNWEEVNFVSTEENNQLDSGK